MINRIELENFRQHTHTVIECSSDEQVLVVAGSNGSGKSTIFEAVTFALFGEGRNGRKNFGTLMKKGAELEGMQVSVTFTVSDATYRIVRRRDSGVMSAVLFVNEEPICEGVRPVNEAVAEILGADAAGWKLASYAQQKDLDALTQLGDTPRARAVSKLLRLDAVGKAAIEARSLSKKESDILEVLGALDVEHAKANVLATEASLLAAQTQIAEANVAITRIEKEINDGETQEQQYQEKLLSTERINGQISAVRGAEDRAAEELEQLKQIEAPEAANQSELDSLRQRASMLDAKVELAEKDAEVLLRKQQVEKLLEDVTVEITQLHTADTKYGSSDTLLASVEDSEKEITVADQQIAELQSRFNSVVSAQVRAATNTSAALDAVTKADVLSDTCYTCEQPISSEVHSMLLTERQENYESAEKAQQKIDEKHIKLEQELTAAIKNKQSKQTALATTTELWRAASSRAGKLDGLLTRQSSYSAQLDRFEDAEAGNIEELLAQRGEVGMTITEIQHNHARAAEYEKTQERRRQLEVDRVAFKKQLETLSAELTEATISVEEQQVHETHRQASSTLRSELNVRGEISKELGRAEEALVSAQQKLSEGLSKEQTRKRHMQSAVTASDAQKVLEDMATFMSTQVRPALESVVKELLTGLSAGMFDDVKIDATYNCQVHRSTDDAWRTVQNLSGGESDLVALGLRLGLAELVNERSGGMNILILDEIFGSQDGGRRETILSTLRTLRERYTQIWCISHIGGIEDVADRIITVTYDNESSVVS